MKLKIYFKYLKQVAVHRWFVAVECWKYGLWLAPFLHDNSKLGPTEFFAYANYFMGDKAAWKERFDYAWNHHWKVNKHHGLYWIVEIKKISQHEEHVLALPKVAQGTHAKFKVLKMPLRYAIEMYCDWVAAGKAYTGKNDITEWYEKNKHTMILHPDTKKFIEAMVYARNDGERKAIAKAGRPLIFPPYHYNCRSVAVPLKDGETP